jgi:hypothetical protein
MTLARLISICILVVFASAIGIASFDAVYAGAPCCALKDGVWIVTKTGKPASPAQIRTITSSPKVIDGGTTTRTPPKPAGGAATGTSGGGGGNHK